MDFTEKETGPLKFEVFSLNPGLVCVVSGFLPFSAYVYGTIDLAFCKKVKVQFRR
jgi:hypothetical protein